MKTNPLTPELLHKMDAYWRAANYLSVGQIYLDDNPLLKQPLKPTAGPTGKPALEIWRGEEAQVLAAQRALSRRAQVQPG